MSTITRQPSPIELKTPADLDHGITLVCAMGGKPAYWLHEVSYTEGNQFAEEILRDCGYILRYTGWIRREDGKQMWTANKRYGLSIGNWTNTGSTEVEMAR